MRSSRRGTTVSCNRYSKNIFEFVGDAWALHYHYNEIDDGGATSGSMGDAEHIDNFVNGENIDGQDVVYWYRAGHSHPGGPVCSTVGPTLRPIGVW